MQSALASLKQKIADSLKVDIKEIKESEEHGDFVFPCFATAKEMKKDANEVAKQLSKNLKIEFIKSIEASGPYINFYIDWEKFGNKILNMIDEKFGGHYIKNKKCLVEHTSINPNASPHVGRARNAIIGDSVVRILKFLGYNTEVHFYVNDVGKQIAILVYGCQNKKIKSLKFDQLLQIYVDANKKIESDPFLEKEIFKLLNSFERGDKNVMNDFKNIVSICIEGQKEILSELNIDFDYFDYESNYLVSKRTEEILKLLAKTGKTFVDQEGRLIMDMNEHIKDSPPLVLTRSDGTSLYGLRDIAYTIDKIEKAKDLNIVVLGEDQKLYFQQLSAALKILGYKAPKVIHYSFVLLPTGKMSTRRGEVVLLEDFMEDAYQKALKEIGKRYPKLSKNEKISRAKKIAVAAVRYAIVKVSPEKNVIFNLEQALRFEGDTGPYLQYTYARANSILKKAKIKAFNSKYLKEKTEIELLRYLTKYPEILNRCLEDLKPHYLANYIYNLCEIFNKFYQTIPVLKAEKGLKEARLKLVYSVKTILRTGLTNLGIEVLEKM